MMTTIQKFIFETPAWKFCLLIALLTLFKTGVWYIPNLGESQAIAQNPFTNPFGDPNAHYIFWSWLGPFVAWLIGATGKWSFFVFHLCFSVAFTLLFIKVVFDNLSNELARSSLVIFATLPVSATSYFWVGPDSITLFLMLLAIVWSSSITSALIIGTLIGMQHFEQGIFATAGLLLATFISQKQNYQLRCSWKFCLALIVGIATGKFVLFSLFDHYSIEVNSGRLYWLSEHIYVLFSQFFFHFHYIVWSILGLGWLVALRFTELGIKSLPFFLSLSGLLLLLPILADQTRVLAIITLPLVTVYWLLNEDFLKKLTKQEISLLFIAWALMPWGWVWEGTPMWSAFPYNIAYILHQMLNWFSVPENPALWPFK